MYAQEAGRIIDGALQELQTLVQLALKEHDFTGVAIVAQLADALVQARARAGASTHPVSQPAPPPSPGRRGSTASVSKGSIASKAPSSTYPNFVRAGDKLVKIGWSKRDAREYDHRAPNAAIAALLDAIREKVGAGEYFKANDVFPIRTSGGDQLPEYQSYLVLKWLHASGLVRKKGRDQYALVVGEDHIKRSESLWAALPAYESRKDGYK